MITDNLALVVVIIGVITVGLWLLRGISNRMSSGHARDDAGRDDAFADPGQIRPRVVQPRRITLPREDSDPE